VDAADGISFARTRSPCIKALLAKGANVNAPAPKGLPATFGDRSDSNTVSRRGRQRGRRSLCNCCSTTARTRWRTAAAAAIHRAVTSPRGATGDHGCVQRQRRYIRRHS